MPIRVVIADDSPTIRGVLSAALDSDPGIVVVGVAENGQIAIEMCERLRPDVMTMDIMMPVMNGLAATEHVMGHMPTPILIVSASTNRGELFRTYDALSAGAVDVLEKPLGHEADGEWERRLIAAVKMVARIRVITHPRARLAGVPMGRPAVSSGSTRMCGSAEVLVIGASTGGPGALVEVLRAIPPTCAIPIAFVLHIGEPFGIAFAEWLQGRIGRRVAYARDGIEVSSLEGEVVMAPPESHLVVRGGRLHMTRSPERNSCRPSVDELFESVAREYGARSIGCLLTGMGRDGAAGLLAMRSAGAATVVQDEATSVVYGMPREAVLLGAAGQVLPIAEIGPALAELATETIARPRQ